MAKLTFTPALVALLLLFASQAESVSLRKETDRKRAPQFELEDASGKTVRLSDFSGKVVLIDFWATWCLPCKASMPWLESLSKQYESDGLVVLGISMDEQGWSLVKPFIEKMRVTYSILMGTRRVAYLYGDVDSLPVAFFVDRDGRVAAIHSGAPGRKDFEKAIRALLGLPGT
jgi:peroxiredoxin